MKNNRLDLYKRTTDKLFNAYFKDELRHGNCEACAVGNILGGPEWEAHFMTVGDNSCGTIIDQQQLVAGEGEIVVSMDRGWIGDTFEVRKIDALCKKHPEAMEEIMKNFYKGKELIEKSGYTKEELMKIENVFEMANQGENKEDYMFNGLVDVLNTLKEIHEIDDNSEELGKFQVERKRKLELV